MAEVGEQHPIFELAEALGLIMRNSYTIKGHDLWFEWERRGVRIQIILRTDDTCRVCGK